MELRLSGPNLPESMNGHISTCGSGRVTVTRGRYHDILDGVGGGPNVSPDIAVAFNAGVWGYSDWDDTLKRLNSSGKMKPRFFVVTSYTDSEAEEDAVKIGEFWRANRCVWEGEVNRWRSRVVRDTKGREEVYHENSHWGCWGCKD